MTEQTEQPDNQPPPQLEQREEGTWLRAYCSALPRGFEHQPNASGSVWAIQNAIQAADAAVLAMRQRRPRAR